MRALFLCIIACTLTLSALGSSEVKNPKSKKKRLIEVADSTFFHEKFGQALLIYDQILEEYPKNHYIRYHRDVAYHLSVGRGSDVTRIYDFEKNGGKVDKFYNYWLGRIHYDRYEFAAAKKHFQLFVDMKVFKSREIREETEKYLERIDRAREHYDYPDDYQIIPLGAPINSKFADLSPAFFGNHKELLFVSGRGPHRKGVYEVFHTIKSKEDWSEPTALKALGKLVKGKAKIEVVNQDGKLFINGRSGKPGLFFSEPNGSSWSEPAMFNEKISEKDLEASFFINDAEDAVYFSSKGEGKRLNLYESHLDQSTNTWSNPEALKGTINSSYDDDNPFLSHDGRYLYFSSNRAESMGGYDVFRSEYNKETQTWSEAENLGFPINTIDDEINFQLNEDNISGFFSSNRLHGLGDFDIYYFHRPGKIMASGQITNKTTQEPVAGALVEFHPVNYTDEYFRTVTDSDGRFQVAVFENEEFLVQLSYDAQLMLVNKLFCKSNELNKSFVVDFKVELPTSHVVDNSIHAPSNTTNDETYAQIDMLGNKFRSGQKAIIRNIYFDFHSFHLKEGYMEVLNQINAVLKSSPDLQIEISGHTDNIGSADTNQYISLQRAESIKAYLVQMGIAPNRLKTVGLGDTQPLASNDDEMGGRELNRRIEVRVLD